jgi:hypothetical protein
VADGERQWATGVLRRLGKQPTERNVSNLVGWAKAEGGHTNNDAGSYGSGSSASPQVDTTQSSAIDSGAASVDAAGAQQAKLSYLENSHDPNALLTLAATLKQTGSAAGGIGGTQQGYSSPAAGDPGLQSEDQLRQHTTAGAAAALSWANSKVGDPSSREVGVNAGGLAGALNKRFGMSNQPWCAMFTSLAVVKGGAPKAAQTASVAQVRAKAQAGGQGYVKGFIRPGQARAGDLVLFGNTQIRSENQRLIEANDRKDRQLETSEKQIERLENENSKLEILVRSLTQQNMDVAGELRREREERERVHEAHADLMLELGRLRERRERGDHDAA